MNQDKKNRINKLIEENDFSGVVSIKINNETIYEAQGGYRNIPDKLENNISTKFALASGAKTFTSIAILLLQEEGKLSIDDPVKKYLDGKFPNYSDEVTIKHLLSHSSGIPDYLDEDKDEDLSHIPWNKMMNPSDYLEYFPKGKMEFEPGSKFKYNNGAFVLLAYIIECITSDYYKYVQDYLDKARLKNTGFYLFNNLPENTANGYIFNKEGTYKTNIYELPIRGSGDGGIYSTVNDIYALWTKLFNNEILNKESMKLFIEPQIPVRNNSYYGLGAWIRKSNKLYTVDMLGQDEGVSYLSSYNIDTKEVYTVISNNDRDAWKVLKIIEE